MPSTLLLRLSGPMQSWGATSRFKQRATEQVPTKSGVLGLLAAAQGRQRTDDLQDLAALTFAVRVDQPGSLLRDYQTAQPWQKRPKDNANLVTRYYLEDAVFVAAIESDNDSFIDELAGAVQRPRFPLFLGRRSCPAPPNLYLGKFRGSAVDALRATDWQATRAHRKTRAPKLSLPIFRDATQGETGIARRDVPISFSQEHREYGWRDVVQDKTGVPVENELGSTNDPFMEAVMQA